MLQSLFYQEGILEYNSLTSRARQKGLAANPQHYSAFCKGDAHNSPLMCTACKPERIRCTRMLPMTRGILSFFLISAKLQDRLCLQPILRQKHNQTLHLHLLLL